MGVNELGKIAKTYWEDIPKHFSNVELDYYVIMPNHLHGIIIINQIVKTRHASSLQKRHVTLSDIIGSFKSSVTKKTREIGYANFAWQPRFYDRIIRNEQELFNIRRHIEQNPLKWSLEKDKPENIFEL